MTKELSVEKITLFPNLYGHVLIKKRLHDIISNRDVIDQVLQEHVINQS